MLDAIRPANRQRHMIAVVVRVPFNSGKRHSVIAGNDDQGLVQLPAPLQLIQHSPQLLIDVFHFEAIVQHVVPHDFIIRPVTGNSINVVQFSPAQFHSRLILITSMRFLRANPKAPRLPFRCSLQKVSEVCRIIVVRDLSCGRFCFPSIEADSRDLTRLPISIIRNSWPPAFACDTCEPTLTHQHFRPAFQLWRKHGHVVASFFILPQMTACQQNGSRRSALGHRSVRVAKQQAFLRNAIKVRGAYPWRTVGSCMQTPIICDDKKNIRRTCRQPVGHQRDAKQHGHDQRTSGHVFAL